jgi:hypothetical protein
VQLTLELEGLPAPASLPGDGAALVAFMSFAAMRGFGAEHPYIALAERMHEVHGVRMGPLTTFYESRVDDEEDAEKLEMAWQAAADLAESLDRLRAALVSDDGELWALLRRAGAAEEFGLQVAALGEAIEPAVAANARVRLSYAL